MRKEKLPILRWSLDALGLLFLVLLFWGNDFCRFHWFPCFISKNTFGLFYLISFIGISMRGLIRRPQKLWIIFLFGGLLALLYNISNGWEGILWSVIIALLFSSIFIFFFWDRNIKYTKNPLFKKDFWDRSVPQKQTKNSLVKKDVHYMPKHDVFFYITLSSIAYALLFYFWYVHGLNFSFVAVFFASPIYICSLFVWVYRGWGKDGCMFMWSLMPFFIILFGFLFYYFK